MMKTINKTSFLVLMLFFMVGFSQCSSTKQTQKALPFEIGEVYYLQRDTVTAIFIPLKSNPKNVELDSIYFRGKQAKLMDKDGLFIGKFKNEAIKKPDIIMSNEPYAEYGNKIPKLPKKTPFELKEDECILSYIEENTVKYFKISGVIKKETQAYP